jgi:hypothetical protein
VRLPPRVGADAAHAEEAAEQLGGRSVDRPEGHGEREARSA